MSEKERLIVQRVTRLYERIFRHRLYDAETPEQRRMATYGLRHAVGFRSAVEQLEHAQAPLDDRAPLVPTTGGAL